MKQLDPKAVWLFFINNFFVVLFLLIWIGLGGISSLFTEEVSSVLIVGSIIGFLAVTALVSFIIAKLTYKYYKYELREDCFRKESGIIWKRYVSIPYERIQNVDIYRGVFARLLGLSDLQIQTAGSSAVVYRGLAAGGTNAEGKLLGVSSHDAELLRDELVKRARGARNTSGV